MYFIIHGPYKSVYNLIICSFAKLWLAWRKIYISKFDDVTILFIKILPGLLQQYLKL